ncbi:MAG: hypothetical protein M1470_06995 [Bacteroidetes bacterium]|nr:hypothetical protein [Bacteroidota bacterium]
MRKVTAESQRRKDDFLVLHNIVSPRLRSFLPPNYFIQVCGMPQGGIFHHKGRYPGAEGKWNR